VRTRGLIKELECARVWAERETAWNNAEFHGLDCASCGEWEDGGYPNAKTPICEEGDALHKAYAYADDEYRDMPGAVKQAAGL